MVSTGSLALRGQLASARRPCTDPCAEASGDRGQTAPRLHASARRRPPMTVPLPPPRSPPCLPALAPSPSQRRSQATPLASTPWCSAPRASALRSIGPPPAGASQAVVRQCLRTGSPSPPPPARTAAMPLLPWQSELPALLPTASPTEGRPGSPVVGGALKTAQPPRGASRPAWAPEARQPSSSRARPCARTWVAASPAPPGTLR